MIPVINLFIGALVKIVLTYTLTGVQDINVKGAAIGTVGAYVVASALNIIAVKRITGVKFDMMLTFVKPVVSALVMSGAVWTSYRIIFGFFGNALSTIVAILIGAVVYCAMLFVTKSIRKDELKAFPKGGKILSMINRFAGKKETRS